jgi:hypothetical protein
MLRAIEQKGRRACGWLTSGASRSMTCQACAKVVARHRNALPAHVGLMASNARVAIGLPPVPPGYHFADQIP